MKLRRCDKGKDDILRTLAVSLAPLSEVNEMLIVNATKRKLRPIILMPPPTVEEDENILVISSDGSARFYQKSKAYRAIVWKLPDGLLWKHRQNMRWL